jgi:hypothetical protein
MQLALPAPRPLPPEWRRRPRSARGGPLVAVWEDRIVALQKDLLDIGTDAGAETLHHHLQKRYHSAVPSVSTIWRVGKARGFVTPIGTSAQELRGG